MLFFSLKYICLFLPTALILFYLVNRLNNKKYGTLALLIASLVFYGIWSTSFLLLLVGSALLNYLIAKSIVSHKKRDLLLLLGLISNIAPLFYYKYYNFFLMEFSIFFGTTYTAAKTVLPLAISFFTFQQIAFLVDSYQRKVSDVGFLEYLLFICFFPQLIAGPIVHYSEMIHQFNNPKKSNLISNFVKGAPIFVNGFIKKIGIADELSPIVASLHNLDGQISFIDAWIGSLAYTFQLYFDFSGYCDMAIGSALLFGIVIPENFKSPYRSTSIQEFWRRWHITLGRWLRDYIYIPLGGNKVKNWAISTNLMITFLIGGIWHGAGWTFILWGFLHGLALCIHRQFKTYKIKVPILLSWLLTFLFVHISWVFFRSATLEQSWRILEGIFSIREAFSYNSNTLNSTENISIIAASALIAFFGVHSSQLSIKIKSSWVGPALAGALLAIGMIFVTRGSPSEFLYFNF